MEEKMICCCGASGWTRVIGWFQAIANGLLTLVSIILVVISAIGRGSANKAKHPDGSPFTPEEIQSLKTTLDVLIGGSVVLAIMSVVGLAMSIVLLRGSYNKNTRYLRAWLIYAVVCLIVWTVETIVMSSVGGSQGGIASTVVSLAVGFVIQGFCLWVVYTHKKEIESATGTAFSSFGN